MDEYTTSGAVAALDAKSGSGGLLGIGFCQWGQWANIPVAGSMAGWTPLSWKLWLWSQLLLRFLENALQGTSLALPLAPLRGPPKST